MPTAGAAPFPYLRQRGDVTLIGVNSAVPTPPGLAQGGVGTPQLQALAALLAKAGAIGLFRVVMIHHPPLTGQAPPARMLRDTAALTECLTRAGVELVIHGHNHLDEYNEIDTRSGRALVIAAGSASMARPRGHEPAARAALYAIRRTPVGWSVEVTRLGIAGEGQPAGVVERRDVQLARSAVLAEGTPGTAVIRC